MLLIPSQTKVFLGLGITDMRKSINGLSAIVSLLPNLDPFSGNLFVFSNRQRNIVKILYWHRNGFCLWQKRLEKEKFKFPVKKDGSVEIDYRQLSWLLEGIDFRNIDAHKKLDYDTVI